MYQLWYIYVFVSLQVESLRDKNYTSQKALNSFSDDTVQCENVVSIHSTAATETWNIRGMQTKGILGLR